MDAGSRASPGRFVEGCGKGHEGALVVARLVPLDARLELGRCAHRQRSKSDEHRAHGRSVAGIAQAWIGGGLRYSAGVVARGPGGDAPVLVSLGPQEQIEYVGPYAVVGVLGKGGMGVVYEVRRGADGPLFALKTIEARFLAMADNQASERFSQEIRVLEKLEHRSVVRMYDSGLAHHPLGYALAFFVMERLRGESLEARLKRNRMGLSDALELTKDLVDGLCYLDAHAVVHRDIKPANIFLSDDRRVVLMDFGLARSAEFTRLTRSGRVIGTLAYMSPEALRAMPVDGRSDVFALGVVLFEMLTGRPPFEAADPTQLVRVIEAGVHWPDISGTTPSVDVQSLVESMLAPDRRARPSAKTLQDELRSLLRALRAPTRSMMAAQAEISPPLVSRVSDSELAEGPDPAANGRRAVLWGVSAAALTFLLGVGVGRWSVVRSAIEVPAARLAPRRAANRSSGSERPASKAAVKPASAPVRPVFDGPQSALEYGVAALEAGRYDDAIDALRQAIEHNPAFAAAHRRLGDALLAKRQFGPAAASYKLFLTLKPNTPDAESLRALLTEIERPIRSPP